MSDEHDDAPSRPDGVGRFLSWPSALAPALASPAARAPLALDEHGLLLSSDDETTSSSAPEAQEHASGVDPEPDPGVRAIPVRSERKAREYALVLQSMGTWHAVHRTWDGVSLVVRTEDLERALAAIRGYEEENRDWPPREAPDRARHGLSFVPVLMFAALAVFLLVTGPAAHDSRWFQRGEAISDLVLSSEPWRAVTALTLHAESMHVMGNFISGSIFASAVQRRVGAGAAALAVLASGIAGNAANALFHHAMGQGDHGSIGASTAIFGAVGILAALQLAIDRRRDRRTKRPLLDVLAPLAAGAALLGTLGAGPDPKIDLGAHLFGFLAGVVIGLVAALFLRNDTRPTRAWPQVVMGALALGLVVGSWELAMLRG